MSSTLRAVSHLLLVSGLAFGASACSSTDAEGELEEEHESQPEGLDAQQGGLSAIDCAESSDTGYSKGSSFSISVVTVDGKKVERATANAYYVMAQASAAAGVNLKVVSGFRTMAEQQKLYSCYQNCNCNGCNLAAKPGYSNHQSGHALDLNTSASGVYDWLSANGGKFGWKRTVPSEKWHWEWWGGGPGGGPCGDAQVLPEPTDPGPPPTAPKGSLRALAATPSGKGYWEVAVDGAVYSYGDAKYFGGANMVSQHEPIMGIAPTPSGGGYWLLATDGAVYSFGDAAYHGGANQFPHPPIVGIASAKTQNGYWIVADDGSIYSFGEVPYHGGANNLPHAPIVGIASSPTSSGYWLVAADGAIYSYGEVSYLGGANNVPHAPIVGIAPTLSGGGYWLMANEGAIYSFGDAKYLGGSNEFPHASIAGIASAPSGYWQMDVDGAIFSFGVDYYGGANTP